MKLKTKKGDLNIFTATIIVLFVFLVIFLIFIYNLQPIIVSSKIGLVSRQAMLRMETEGGITNDIRQKIIDRMDFKGFEAQYLTIEPATNITDSTKAEYGNEIYLKITYRYKYKSIELKGITGVKVVDEEKVITQELNTTSKNAE